MQPSLWLPFCLWPGSFIVILVIVIVFGRRRYKYPLAQRPTGADWVETTERFHDPVTNEDVAVWYNPQTGERIYVRR